MPLQQQMPAHTCLRRLQMQLPSLPEAADPFRGAAVWCTQSRTLLSPFELQSTSTSTTAVRVQEYRAHSGCDNWQQHR